MKQRKFKIHELERLSARRMYIKKLKHVKYFLCKCSAEQRFLVKHTMENGQKNIYELSTSL